MDFGSSPIKFVWCSTNPIYWDSLAPLLLLISYVPLVYTCRRLHRPIYWIDYETHSCLTTTREQGIYEVQCRTSIIMENKQRHGIWSLLKALSISFGLWSYCSGMKWFSFKLMVAYLHSKLLHTWSYYPSQWSIFGLFRSISKLHTTFWLKGQ